MNSACHATLADGTKVVIRTHPEGVKNGYFYVEAVATQLAKDLGLPTCSTYFVSDSETPIPFDYMITEALPGNVIQALWPLDSELDKKIVEQTGRILAKINSIKVDGFEEKDHLYKLRYTIAIYLYEKRKLLVEQR